jgi:uncharacterized membrane protein YphA (DoxX/SURF4 family)
MSRIRVVNIIIASLILLFIYAATSKLLDFEKFRAELSKSPLLAFNVILFAVVVPTIEIGLSIMLVIERFKLLALYGSFTLMALFTGYIIAIMNFAEYIPCSCGGILQNMSWGQHLVFNIGFVLISATGVLIYKSNRVRQNI